MKKKLLLIKDLTVEVDGKQVIREVSLEVGEGEIHTIVGPNGSGKSSLANTLLGNQQYQVMSGQTVLENEDLLKMGIDERARAGLYVTWQNPVEIPGVSVFSLSRQFQGKLGEFKNLGEFKKYLGKLMTRVGLSEKYLERGINEGFSGGEKKRLELVQLMLLVPKLAILDEIDSGLDKIGRQMTREIVSEMREAGTSFIIITHDDQWWEGMKITKKWVMEKGKLKIQNEKP